MTRLVAACLAVLFLSLGSLHAQSSVWMVTRGEHVLYLGGTCHTLRPSDLPLPAEFTVAFEASDTLVFETDIARMQSAEAQGKMMAQALYTDGTKLSSVLSAEAWEAVSSHAATLGLPAAALETFEPSVITLTLLLLESQRLGFTPDGVDVQLDRRARAAGKTVTGLETLEEQISFITAMGKGRESELVLSTLRDIRRLPEMLDEMVAAWRAGDLQKIDTLMSAEMRREFPEMHEELLVNRNRAWLPEIEAFLGTPSIEFVLVGAAHLAGKDGLIAALEDSGCRIAQITAAAE